MNQTKLIAGADLDRLLALWRFREYKIVFTNGCFDILHAGHISYLQEAKALGDMLIIGLNTDASVKRLKGETRPINNEQARAFVLSGLASVNAVVLFDQDTPLHLIEKVQPNVLVKGGDYEVEKIVGYKTVKAKGGEVLTIPFLEGFSSSEILKRI